MCGTVGGQHRTSNKRHYVALVTAQDPLKMVAVEPQVLVSHTIESYWTLQGDRIDNSQKEILPLEPQFSPVDQKRCSFRLSKALARAVTKVHSRVKLRQHRGDTGRKTVAEPTKEVIGRAPLRRRWGRMPGRRC